MSLCVAGSCVKTFFVGQSVILSVEDYLVGSFVRSQQIVYFTLENVLFPAFPCFIQCTNRSSISNNLSCEVSCSCPVLFPNLSYRNSLTVQWIVVSSVIAFLPPMTFMRSYSSDGIFSRAIYIYCFSRQYQIYIDCVVFFLSAMCETDPKIYVAPS